MAKGKGYQDIIYDKATFREPVYRLQSEKLVSDYQGRIYVGDAGVLDDRGKININLLGEYFGEGYKEYALKPENLKAVDTSLYMFIKGVL